jgi:glutamate formiminotransferase / 5-formyltetrahydrofolate cyclo-ligase
MEIIECVPNFSEGRDKKKVIQIADTLIKIPGIKLLDFSMDFDHNRSVFTFIGSRDDVIRAALAACNGAIELIDMRNHEGVHPRIGAVDVVPFIPLMDATMGETVKVAHSFGREFARINRLPVYFYGEAALAPERRELSHIRRGGYEGLRAKLVDPQWIPDAGPAVLNEKSGASAVGARMPLIAFNVNLKTDDLAAARAIAVSVRESGGGLKCVRAMGVPLTSRNLVQVSMNLIDYQETSICKAFDAVKEKAAAQGIEITESELIGLVPREAFADVTCEYLKLNDFSDKKILDTHF